MPELYQYSGKNEAVEHDSPLEKEHKSYGVPDVNVQRSFENQKNTVKDHDHGEAYVFTISPHQIHRHLLLDKQRAEHRAELRKAALLRKFQKRAALQMEDMLSNIKLVEKQRMLKRLFKTKVQSEQRTLNMVKRLLVRDEIENEEPEKIVMPKENLVDIANETMHRLKDTQESFMEANRQLVLEHAAEKYVGKLRNKANEYIAFEAIAHEALAHEAAALNGSHRQDDKEIDSSREDGSHVQEHDRDANNSNDDDDNDDGDDGKLERSEVAAQHESRPARSIWSRLLWPW